MSAMGLAGVGAVDGSAPCGARAGTAGGTRPRRGRSGDLALMQLPGRKKGRGEKMGKGGRLAARPG